MEYAVVWFGAFVLGFVVGVWVTYKTYLMGMMSDTTVVCETASTNTEVKID